ncbi:unnamed protein product [Durusdinium trenchii]
MVGTEERDAQRGHGHLHGTRVLLHRGAPEYRRALWSRSFHPSYVSFTFPLASTATGALLVPERLPFMASPLLSAYGQLLLYVATAVILAVQVRFIYFLISLRQKKK